MSRQNDMQVIRLLAKANDFKQVFDDFNELFDNKVRSYLSFLFKVSLCIYHEVEGTKELEEMQFEASTEFQMFLNKYSKHKLLNKIVFPAMGNGEGNSNAEEKFEFSLCYDESEFSTNEENLKKCVEFYVNSNRPIKLSDVETHYTCSNDLKALESKISKVIEHLRFGNANTKVIKSKVKEIEEILENFEFNIRYFNIRDEIEDLREEFMKQYYLKLILKLQQNYEYNDALNNAEECAVCLKEFQSGNSVTKLECGHAFCTECIEKWFEQSITCPCCRKNIDIGS